MLLLVSMHTISQFYSNNPVPAVLSLEVVALVLQCYIIHSSTKYSVSDFQIAQAVSASIQ